MYQPLADLLRPTTLDEVYGQEHILGEGAVLRRLIESGNIFRINQPDIDPVFFEPLRIEALDIVFIPGDTIIFGRDTNQLLKQFHRYTIIFILHIFLLSCCCFNILLPDYSTKK